MFAFAVQSVGLAHMSTRVRDDTITHDSACSESTVREFRHLIRKRPTRNACSSFLLFVANTFGYHAKQKKGMYSDIVC